MSAIEISGLTKTYGEVLANDEVTFSVEEGEVFGYLGPNGAGKTTTIRTLMGFQSPTSGTATVLGADVRDEAALVEARERVGYLPANPQFEGSATGEEILDLHGSIKGESRRAELLDLFDVPVERAIRGYSTGQQQKLGLVLSFMHDPDLVVMDEPTAGLDPLVQQRFNEFVREERRAGTTVFLSSHVLSEVRRVCDRVGIVRDGRIVTVEGVEDLMGRSGKFVRLRVARDLAADAVDLAGVHDLSVRAVEGPHGRRAVATAGSGGDASADPGGGDGDAPAGSTDGDASRFDDGAATGDPVTELTFTYTGEFDALVEFVGEFHVLELDVEEAPLERVFMRFYGDDVEGSRDRDVEGSRDAGGSGSRPDADPERGGGA